MVYQDQLCTIDLSNVLIFILASTSIADYHLLRLTLLVTCLIIFWKHIELILPMMKLNPLLPILGNNLVGKSGACALCSL